MSNFGSKREANDEAKYVQSTALVQLIELTNFSKVYSTVRSVDVLDVCTVIYVRHEREKKHLVEEDP